MGVIKESESDIKAFRAIKNAVSHKHIEIGNENGMVATIRFEDKIDNKTHTRLEFKIDELKDYALFMAELHLEREMQEVVI